ncbi:NADH:ubiquinone oxidoreductase [Methanoculleus taiwanensis]|uniref:NADH:ubiquinone oxidoreductase n=1 Tax=Methanoculleus taiwanensis TaxID=1550565 RepID=A0A498H0Q3_9EURY|nr:proton-conducting transporter membrane subunit [Methanoculleus taiwanensis]RXE56223.1 NADH:ubiquinone oxidoreductase [Methanoculleus taiwanensis]
MTGDVILQNAPALLLAVPMLAAFATPFIGRYSAVARNIWVIAAMTLTAAIGFILAYDVFTAGTVIYTFGALDPASALPLDSGGIPIRIIFTVDAMSAFMVIIAAISGFAVMLYTMASESKSSGKDGFYALFLLLIVGIMGMVCTGDLFNFFVFLEINSLAGAALVAYRVDKGVAVEAGLKYAVISTIGGLFVLFSIALLYGQYNALNIAMLASSIQYTALDKIALVLLLAALAMKAGAVPMHFWTPDAYSMAPGSITALLVVASQASLYGVFRVVFTLYNVVLDYVTIGWIIIILGILSMFVGVTMALVQKDVKRLMAYHAVSQTGYMLLGLGVGLAVLGQQAALDTYGIVAMEGGIFHIINHAMYKGLLFLTAGAIIYRTGIRSLNKLGGLGHSMKWTMIFFIIGALAIAGIPPFSGFASKLLIYESVFLFSPVLSIIAMVVSILTLASFVKVFHSIFMGPALPEFAGVKEAPLPMLVGMGILAAITIAFGIAPELVVDTIVTPAALALVDQGGYIASVLGGA